MFNGHYLTTAALVDRFQQFIYEQPAYAKPKLGGDWYCNVVGEFLRKESPQLVGAFFNTYTIRRVLLEELDARYPGIGNVFEGRSLYRRTYSYRAIGYAVRHPRPVKQYADLWEIFEARSVGRWLDAKAKGGVVRSAWHSIVGVYHLLTHGATHYA